MGIRVRRLNTAAFDVVARGLTHCTSLTHLRISDIMIEAGAVHGLAKVLGQCPALAHLDLAWQSDRTSRGRDSSRIAGEMHSAGSPESQPQCD